MHGIQHDRMLSHAEVIIAAPDGDFLRAAIGACPDRMRKLTIAPLNIDERSVPALFVQSRERLIKLFGIIHAAASLSLAHKGTRIRLSFRQL